MATFQYVARNTRGEEVAGVLQADSSAAAVRALDDKKLFPVSVKEKAEAAAARPRRFQPARARSTAARIFRRPSVALSSGGMRQ